MHLIHVTEQSFWEGIKLARSGNRVYDISHAVQQYVEANGCSVVRDFVGHGVGAKLHEPPEVPNFGPAGHGPRLQPGMTIAVEPMVCAGDWRVKVLDGWTVKTLDGSLAAHYENTISSPKVTPRSSQSPRMEPMFDYTGQIVQATAGRDKGGVFCVVAIGNQRQERLLLADGKRRKVSRPKGKRSWAMYGILTAPGRISSTLSWISSGQAGTYPTEN